MAYKRQIDQLPIIPAAAQEHNVTCHYCIVGCGYKAYTWPMNKQGGTAAADNKFNTDLSKQQPAETIAWYSPSMYNIVRQNGQDVHIVIKPDKDCVVNSGLGSVRGARMAEMSYSQQRNTQLQRLTDPMVWRYGQMQPTGWDDALDLVARVTVGVISDMGEDGLFVSAFDRVLREQGKNQDADKFKGFDWKTEEDAFVDGYHGHEKGGQFVTYERLRAMGTNGFQEPAADFRDGKIVGTKRLFADGKFNTKNGKAKFMETQWRGLEAAGKEAEMKKFPFLINNGRANVTWQSSYLDQDNEFVTDRMPYPYMEMNPRDMDDLKLKAGDLVEVYNDNGSTQAMVYPTPTARPKQTFMIFAQANGVQGNVVSPGVNELIIPNYKQTWANIRKLADAPEGVRHLSFKSFGYTA